jgi:cytochrome c-type biogenesis protein CcmH
MRLPALLLAALLALGPSLAHADEATPTENDPVKQSRTVRLTEQLRCLVCQNQTIADSSAELAVDLRRQVREQVAAGRTDEEIIKYMTDRYGDFVLYKPPVKTTTILLWAGPVVLLIVGLLLLFRIVRNRRELPDAAPLTPEERARAKTLLAEPNKDAP